MILASTEVKSSTFPFSLIFPFQSSIDDQSINLQIPTVQLCSSPALKSWIGLAHFGNSRFGLAHFRNSQFGLAHFRNSWFGLAHFGNSRFGAGPFKKTFEKMSFFGMFSTPMSNFSASNSYSIRWHGYSAKRIGPKRSFLREIGAQTFYYPLYAVATACCVPWQS